MEDDYKTKYEALLLFVAQRETARIMAMKAVLLDITDGKYTIKEGEENDLFNYLRDLITQVYVMKGHSDKADRKIIAWQEAVEVISQHCQELERH